MEWIAEGLTLCFIGLLVALLVMIGGLADTVVKTVVGANAGMLLVMAVLTAATGARTPVIPIKICPFVKTAVATLFIAGILL